MGRFEQIKYCKGCNRTLPRDQFHQAWHRQMQKHYPRERCKDCYPAYHAAQVRPAANLRTKRLRLEALSHYSNGELKCVCCGESEYLFLSLDHINGGGSKERRHLKSNGYTSSTDIFLLLKRKGWPNGFQVLCHNCNLAKGFYGECPHEANQRKSI